MVAEMNQAPEGYKFRSYEALVLTEGTTWTNARVDLHGPYRECYLNTFQAAQKNGWEYVEGYAISVIPIGHAWCLDSGQVVETTWKTAGSEYRGVVLPLDYVSLVTRQTGVWGVLPNDYLNGFELLREGMNATRPKKE